MKTIYCSTDCFCPYADKCTVTCKNGEPKLYADNTDSRSENGTLPPGYTSRAARILQQGMAEVAARNAGDPNFAPIVEIKANTP